MPEVEGLKAVAPRLSSYRAGHKGREMGRAWPSVSVINLFQVVRFCEMHVLNFPPSVLCQGFLLTGFLEKQRKRLASIDLYEISEEVLIE